MKPLAKLFFLLCAALCALPAGCETTLTIYYTASLNGNLDGCTCEMNPVAGLVKRAAFLRTLETSGPTLILDAGDIFDEYPDPDLNKHILAVYQELGYDAIAVGDQELANGPEALLDYAEASPLICHNLRFMEKNGSTRSFSPEPRVIEVHWLNVGIFALVDPSIIRTTRSGIKVMSPTAAAQEVLRTWSKKRVDVKIALYHGPYRSARELVESCPDIDLLIFGHEGRLVAPEKIGNTVVVSPGDEGDYLGILELTLTSGGINGFRNRFEFFSYAGHPDDPKVRDRIEIYKQNLRSKIRKDY